MTRRIDLNAVAIDAALDRLVAGGDAPASLLRGLFDAVRPRDAADLETATARFEYLTECCRTRPQWRRALWAILLGMLSGPRAVSFFSDAGILAEVGFFGEIWRRVTERFLPRLKDSSYCTDAVAIIFHRRKDYQWLSELPTEVRQNFWRALYDPNERDAASVAALRKTMLDAIEVLSIRIAAMGLHPELKRVLPDDKNYTATFIELVALARRHADACLSSGISGAPADGIEKPLLDVSEQCLATVCRARSGVATRGVSLKLTYLLVRLEQSLRRLQLLAQVLAVRLAAEADVELLDIWTTFTRDAVRGVIRRDSVREEFRHLTGLLALRITENSGRTGEHYIATNRSEYFRMWRAAAGAGLLIGVMALVKILASKLEFAPLNQAFVYSMNYALGFVLIHLLHFTIATKQPAMTAATIAAAASQVRGRLIDIERLADLVVATARSQIAAILGNVLVALPTAIGIGMAFAWWQADQIVAPDKAFKLLADLDPVRSLALPHAAIAGIYLFLTGLISGYFDNLAAYERLGERIAALRWLRWLIGSQRAWRVGIWVDQNLGGISGNVFFGVCLGITGTLGLLFGLPIDIRHVAFAAANYGYALQALDFAIPPAALLWSGLGVLLIGMTNLAVSFTLALWIALKSHDIDFRHTGALFLLIGR